MESGKMELTIKVICEELPGTAYVGSPATGMEVGRQDIYLGIQHGDEMIQAAPATKKRIVFEPGFRVLQLPGDRTNFLGPFAKGTPAQRFFYLSWAVKDDDGGFTVIGRTKVHLSHLRWSEIEQALETGKPLTVTLRLTDPRGRPRYASISAEEASWQR
jgi:hypothetical protein